MNDFTQQGIKALKTGNKPLARRLLQQAVQQDVNDALAWMWLAATVDTPAERADCLRQVLRIDPTNAAAQRALAELEMPAPPPPAAEPPRAQAAPPKPAKPTPAEPAPDPLPPPVKRKPAAKTGRKRRLPMVAGLAVVLVLACGISATVLLRQLGNAAGEALVEVESAVLTSLTPAVDMTATPDAADETAAPPTAEPSATPRPTATIAPTETFVPLGPVVQQQRERIQQEVSTLRGLPVVQADVPLKIVSRDRADRYLRSQYVTADFLAESERERLTLAALGLAAPNYDTTTNLLNRMVDGLGGFYTLDGREIFVMGLRFGAVESYIYAHTFTHALLDQNYQTAQAITSPDCTANSEPCMALAALVEGDAQYLMTEWWKKYAKTNDYRDILLFRPPALALAENNPPPFATENNLFGSERGLKFVNYLYNLGGWPNVNKAYANPPQTSEQIMHPRKYVSGEGELPVPGRPLQDALGADWQVVRQNVLGEWYTYLVLAFGVDSGAQIDPERAAAAAAGWGGDSLQVLQHTPSGATALAIQWAWDDEKEAGEFFPVLFQYMNDRYRGQRLDNISGECWENGGQVSCIYLSGSQTLWLQAPDAGTIDLMHALYPEFP